VDRKLDFYRTAGLSFPRHNDPHRLQTNTVLDGEFVIDLDVRSGDVSPSGNHMMLFSWICSCRCNRASEAALKRVASGEISLSAARVSDQIFADSLCADLSLSLSCLAHTASTGI